MTLRHRLWLRQANGPLPDPLPPIFKRCCPGLEKRQISCSNFFDDRHPRGIYLNQWDWRHKPTFFHELTHWFDRQYLTDSDREEIRLHFDWPRRPWWWPPGTDLQSEAGPSWTANCERLARAGVWMYLHPREHKWLRRKLRAAKERT